MGESGGEHISLMQNLTPHFPVMVLKSPMLDTEVSIMYHLFMPLTRKYAGGIVFLGCPSVHTAIMLLQYLENPLVEFIIFGIRVGVPRDELMQWLDFICPTSKVNEMSLKMVFIVL